MNDQFSQFKGKPLLQLLSFALPAILGMLLTSGIIVVDGLFIGRFVGQEGLAATNMSLPVLYLFLAITIMVAIGGSVKTSHALGKQDKEKARGLFSLTTLLALLIVLPLALLVRLLLNPILGALGEYQNLSQWIRPYLGTILWFYPAMMLNILFSIFLRVEGKPLYSLFFGVAGNLLNLLLDYLMIVRWNMGMKGAALASGISVLIPMGLGLLYFARKSGTLGFHGIPWGKKHVGAILFNGSSEMIGQLSVAITVAIFNGVILKYLGVQGVAAFTVVGYICFIQIMFITGLSEGLTPILGYSFGAKDWKHIKQVTRIALILGFLAGTVCWLATMLLGPSMAGAFSKGDPQIMDLAKQGFWLYTLAFLFNGFNLLASAFFTSQGDPKRSGLIASLRGLVLINGLVILLPRIMGSMGIWLSFPLAEGLTMVVAALLIVKRINSWKELPGEQGNPQGRLRA